MVERMKFLSPGLFTPWCSCHKVLFPLPCPETGVYRIPLHQCGTNISWWLLEVHKLYMGVSENGGYPNMGSFDGDDADKQWFLCLYLYLWGTWSLDCNNYTILFTFVVSCFMLYIKLFYFILCYFTTVWCLYIYIVLYIRHLFYEWYIPIWGHIHIIYIYTCIERVKPELWSFGPGFMTGWVCLIHGQVPPAPSRAVAAVARCLAGVNMGYIVTTMI